MAKLLLCTSATAARCLRLQPPKCFSYHVHRFLSSQRDSETSKSEELRIRRYSVGPGPESEKQLYGSKVPRIGTTYDAEMWRQISISVQNASRNGPSKQFWSEIRRLRPTYNMWMRDWNHHKASLPTLLILFTPSVLSWMRDEMFIPKLLRILEVDSSHEGDKLANHSIVCACVDGITMRDNSTLFSTGGLEGFSILSCPTPHLFAVPKSPPSVSTSASITFKNQKVRSVRVPLANTLFHNGEPFYLKHECWQREQNIYTKTAEISGFDNIDVIALAGTMGIKGDLQYSIPTRPVTPFRTIEAGLGNIIKTLRYDVEVGPASQELETVISTISQAAGGTKIDVWALILPPGKYDKAVYEAQRDQIFKLVGDDYFQWWLSKGARICRVVSGGGGWGPKQGLLSLDYIPAASTSEISDLATLSDMSGSVEAGSSIQFIVENHDFTSPQNLPQDSLSSRVSYTFGAVPSIIDNIPTNTDTKEPMKITSRFGHFGCVSGSGIHVTLREFDDSIDQVATNEKLAEDPHTSSESTSITGLNELQSESTTSEDVNEKFNPYRVHKSHLLISSLKPDPYKVVTDFKLDIPHSYVTFDARPASQDLSEPLQEKLPVVSYHEALPFPGELSKRRRRELEQPSRPDQVPPSESSLSSMTQGIDPISTDSPLSSPLRGESPNNSRSVVHQSGIDQTEAVADDQSIRPDPSRIPERKPKKVRHDDAGKFKVHDSGFPQQTSPLVRYHNSTPNFRFVSVKDEHEDSKDNVTKD